MPETDLNLLIDAARQSGDIARSFFGKNPQVWDKADDAGPVTAADLAVNEMLVDVLGGARPDYGWLSEETEDDDARLATKRQFLVDPIDGTRAFIQGSKDWAHSLAIVEDGAVVAAAVYLPMRDQMFSARLGGGAFCNGAAIRVSQQASLCDAQVLSHKANLRPEFWQSGCAPQMHLAFRSSLAYRLCLVANGAFDAMLTLRPTWEWDVAAGILILTEAGGTATTQTGAAPVFNNPHPQLAGLVAAGQTHQEICAQLRA